jgi:hypothetical protein
MGYFNTEVPYFAEPLLWNIEKSAAESICYARTVVHSSAALPTRPKQ